MQKKLFFRINIILMALFIFFSVQNQSLAVVNPGEYNEQFSFSDILPQSQYIVQNDDSLYLIARRFGVSVTDLRRANNIWSGHIYPGQRLIIPGQAHQVTYRVQWGDSLYKISRQFGVSISAIRSANNLTSDNLWVGQSLVIPGTGTDRSYNSNNYTIIVDAGHGGMDPGAITYYNSRLIKESDIVLDIANRLTTLLNEAGYNAIVTRSGDYAVALWRRVQIAHQHNADLFVSIHADNSPTSPARGGSNVYISPNASWNTYQLADTVQRNLEQTTGRPPNIMGRVLRRNFTVIMQSRPAILVETGFLSNWNDLTSFQTAQFRYLIARGIFNGIEQWLN